MGGHRGIRIGAMLAVGAATLGASAAVIVPVAGGGSKSARCGRPEVTVSVSSTDRTAVVTFAIVSPESGGSYEAVFKTSGISGFSGTFPTGGGTYDASLGVSPGTHYQGTLTAQNDCGSGSADIDIRAPKSPPPPACAGPPAIDALDVSSVTADAAVVTYVVRSGDAVAAHVLVDPGGIDVGGSIPPGGGTGQAPLSGLIPSTTYAVTLVARNGCGDSTRQATFTTARPPGCVTAPVIDGVWIGAVRARTAFVFYSVRADWTVTAEVAVSPRGGTRTATLAAPGGDGYFALSRLRPGVRYSVTLTVSDDCGAATAKRAFISSGRVAVSVVGSGSVTSTPAGIACRHRCVALFHAGRALQLVARPAGRFLGWGGDCTGRAPVCSLRARDQTVTARFRRG